MALELAEKIQKTFADFDIDMAISDATEGVRNFYFTFQTRKPVRMKTIKSFEEDLRYALANSKLEIQAPIPDESLIGVTLPKKGALEPISFTVCNPHEDAEFMSDYNCWITDMKSAGSSQDIATVKNAHGCIRKVIEHVLKVKYPVELTKEINTVGNMLTKLEEPGGSYAATSKRTEINSVLTNPTHHDNSANGQYPVAQLGIEDYKKDIRDAFQLIKTL